MAEITAADVKKLRDLTGAGMMDCKKALVESDGDFDVSAAAPYVANDVHSPNLTRDDLLATPVVVVDSKAVAKLLGATDSIAVQAINTLVIAIFMPIFSYFWRKMSYENYWKNI